MGLEIGLREWTRAAFAIWLVLAALMLAAAPASAQGTPPPPVPMSVDGHGVNLTTGDLVMGSVDVDIGPADHHGVRFTRQWVKNGWRYSDVPSMSGSTSNPVVSHGGGSIAFSTVSGAYVPAFQDGSTLSNDRATFTGSDGTVILFGHAGYGLYGANAANLGLGTKITYPDGTVWNFNYHTGTYSDGGTVYYLARLSSITSSTGYQVKFAYSTNSLSLSTYDAWSRMTKATAINNAVEYCDPLASSCSLSNTWPEATYTGGTAARPATVTGPGGATTYTYDTNLKMTGIQAPGFSSNNVTIGYHGIGTVSTVTVAGGTWTYGYLTGQTTVTDPLARTRTTNYTSSGLVTSNVAGGLTTQFSYCVGGAGCPAGLLQTVTMPEGNKITYVYDTRGNVVCTMSVAKGAGTQTCAGPSDASKIVSLASYPANCANQKTCNKPTSTTDARGLVTDYTYDATHGGILTVTAPANVSGVRPQTRFSYSNYQAYYKNSAGSIVASGANIALPTQVASCRTTSSCTNGTDERKTVMNYGPQTVGVANNLNPVSATTSRGDGALAATSTHTYDNYGRALTADGPMPGTADSSRIRYNLAGQVIGQVGPDPDGAGAGAHPATRYSYNARGQGYLTESGIVTDLSDTAWAAFTANDSTLTEFDTYGRPVRQKVRSGGTDYQIVDTVYDTTGHVSCSIVRMDPAQWSSVATSCTPPQTTGPNGPDRVTYNYYDALARVWKVTAAFGTAAAANQQIATFSNNGQLATLTDGAGNKTTYEYDGHDRLVKTYFPSPTTDGVSSTTDFEQVDYDANGNVTSFRTRRNETLTMTYDNLDRLTRKTVPERSGLDRKHTRDVFFAYDLLGGMDSACFGGTATTPETVTTECVTNSSNALGQLDSATITMDGASRTLGYGYDVAGNQVQVTHPDGNYFYYHRHGSGSFYYATLSNNAPLFHPTRDTAGRVNLLRRLNTSTAAWDFGTTYGYDAISRLATLAHNPTGATYDTTTTLAYNPASQVKNHDRANDLFAFTNANSTTSYTANGLNQYSAVAGANYSYDAGGNLTYDGTHTYTYDVENRMVGRTAATTATLRYDPLGRLYEVIGSDTGTTRFLYDGDALVAEYNTSGTLLRRYVHGLGGGDDPLVWFEGSSVADSARRYLYADERGSVVAVTDSSGNVTYVNSYDEYGVPNSSGNDISTRGRFRYTGQAYIPELGMYYYKARMYSPKLGRFMQTDPIGYGDGMNMYAYVGNDPVNLVDPTGLERCFRLTHISYDYYADDRTRTPIPGTTTVDGISYYCIPDDVPGVNQEPRNPPSGGGGSGDLMKRQRCTAPGVSVTRSGNRIAISTTLRGQNLTQAQVQRAADAINRRWSGTFGPYSVTTRVTVDMVGGRIRLTGTSRDAIAGVPPLGRYTQPFINDVNPNLPGYGATVAHEFGHILGLPDRYTRYTTGTRSDPGYEDNIMGANPTRGGVTGADIRNVIANSLGC